MRGGGGVSACRRPVDGEVAIYPHRDWSASKAPRRVPRSLRSARCASPGTYPRPACSACPRPSRALSHPSPPRVRRTHGRGAQRASAPIPPCAASRHGRRRAARPPDKLHTAPPTGTPAYHPRAPPRPPGSYTHTAADGPSADRRSWAAVPSTVTRRLREALVPPAPPAMPLASGRGRRGTHSGKDSATARGEARAARGRLRRGIKWASGARAVPRAAGGRHAGEGTPPPSRSPLGGSTGVAAPPVASVPLRVNAAAGGRRGVQDLGRYVSRQTWRARAQVDWSRPGRHAASAMWSVTPSRTQWHDEYNNLDFRLA